jgi:response regulator RpfG family c-di-GMP phosphodiesterase
VQERGRLGAADALDYVIQAARGLEYAHAKHVIHRDIKPSNLLLASPSGGRAQGEEDAGMLRVKLVDFGLAREFSSELTAPGTLLGSIDFMAPEQSLDPSAVGKESDIYGLGATLFWLLTGEGPYPFIQHVGQALRYLQQNPPRRLRELLPTIPEPLDDLVAQMLHRDPANRPSSPRAVMQALAPFFQRSSRIVPVVGRQEEAGDPSQGGSGARILCVDDEALVLDLYRHCLLPQGHDCEMAEDGSTCLARAADKTFDLVLLDLNLPDMHGYEVCRELRRRSGNPSMQILVVSSAGNPDDLAECLTEGADDYMCKPFAPQQLLAKVDQALKRKRTLENARQESESLRAEQTVLRRDLVRWTAEARQAQELLMRVLTQLSQSREGETARHQRRLQQYAVTLARESRKTLSDVPAWSGLVDERFLEHLERCTPLHDLGKVGLPDDVLLKPGTLEPSERALIQTHVLIGDHLLSALSEQEGVLAGYLQMAQQIVRHHHERFDGRGYPDRLAGNAIPPAARLVSIADVYDALRRLRPHKPAMSHQEAIRVLVNRSPGQFDPWLMRALLACEGEFERIFSAFRD